MEEMGLKAMKDSVCIFHKPTQRSRRPGDRSTRPRRGLLYKVSFPLRTNVTIRVLVHPCTPSPFSHRRRPTPLPPARLQTLSTDTRTIDPSTPFGPAPPFPHHDHH